MAFKAATDESPQTRALLRAKLAGRRPEHARTSASVSGCTHEIAFGTAAANADSAINCCYARKWASGDIYVRKKSPGTPTVVQELGGEWRRDHATNKCLASAQFVKGAAA